MPRTYVDNAYNRSLGRVGMTIGSAPVSRSSGSVRIGSSYANSSSITSNSTPRTYVDNPSNQRLGRVGLPLGTAVHSRSSGISSNLQSSSQSSSTIRTYVDNPYNRRLGRVGLPLGTAVHSRSSGISAHLPSSSQPPGTVKTYVDNAHNRRLGRVGLPLGTAVHSSSGSSVTKNYFDNALNREFGSMPHPGVCTKESKKMNLFKPFKQFEIETANLQDILNQIMVEKQTATNDDEYAHACNQAEGIVNRHEAALTQRHSALKRPPWLRGGEIINFYDLELGNKIGCGGFGDVYVAIWKEKYHVAVKKFRVQRVSRVKKQQFEEEVKLYSTLSHPAIVTFYGACVETPNLAIVMEFMPKGSLYDVLHIESDQLTDMQKYSMIEDALSALSYLHEKKIAHRDIKSMNIMACEDMYHCKLADFGLALKDESDTYASVADFSVVGTIKYSPPEVLNGERLTIEKLMAADIYSMALTIVELITEEEPFKGCNQHQLRKAVLDGERPSLESTEVPTELKALLSTCMSQAVSMRPSADCFLASYLEAKYQLFS